MFECVNLYAVILAIFYKLLVLVIHLRVHLPCLFFIVLFEPHDQLLHVLGSLFVLPRFPLPLPLDSGCFQLLVGFGSARLDF